jgi:peptidoglycan/xylan/chitin deacetylase (PgdA/CDA1 family)
MKAMIPNIVLTWDDGPNPPIAANILQLADRTGVQQIEFYWNGATLLLQSIKDELGISIVNGIPRLRDGRSFPWMEWFDQKRGKTSRQAFVLGLLDSEVVRTCRAMREYIDIEHLDELIGYHGMTHEDCASPSHPIGLWSAEFEQEFEFFDVLVRAAFDAPHYAAKKGRTPYGAGLRFDIPNPAQKYQQHFPRMLRESRHVRPHFEWNAWEADTVDYRNGGYFDEGKVIEIARKVATKLGKERSRVLLHERYYAEASPSLVRLFVKLGQ